MSEALIGVIIGGALTAIPSFWIQWLAIRSERRRQRMDLAYKVGIEAWSQAMMKAQRIQDEGLKNRITVDPVETYIVHQLLMAEAFDGKCPDENELVSIFRKASAINGRLHAELSRGDHHKNRVPSTQKTNHGAQPATTDNDHG